MITNQEFLNAIFGAESPWVHVTDFTYDPSNIPKERHLMAWKGDYFSRYTMQANTNQYFTISLFYCDEQQQARRRKALFRMTPCIVLDDVKEKLSMTEVDKLPKPSWILESSTGSEQWGYILDTPCTDRAKVENLLDGLVANGLAPDGKDPGMKGVTRYVRLPEGINNKASKLVNGQPFKCRMLLWQPQNKVTIESLATPFAVNLDALRRESRVDGAADVSDHPLVNIPDIITIKEVRSDGRFDIRCPWVDEHTGSDDSGSAVFTNEDGSIGFKCHHGACQNRTGKDLLHYIEGHRTGFTANLKNWQVMREFTGLPVSFTGELQHDRQVEEPLVSSNNPTTPSFMDGQLEHTSVAAQPTVSFMDAPVATTVQPDAIQMLCDQLRRQHPSSAEARVAAEQILKHVDDMPKIDQKHWHESVCDIMQWNKSDFKEIVTDLRKKWYGDKVSSAEFYDNVVFVKELNQFYDFDSRIFYSTEAFQNSFSDQDSEARKTALQEGRVTKVDRIDYAPKHARVFTECGTVFANTWSDKSQSSGEEGDYSRWLEHFDVLGWEEYRKHVTQWLAFTLRYPDRKINHMLLLGSGEGCGKDFILYPLVKAMGDNHTTIEGEDLLSDFRDFLLSTKYLHINEAELGDRREAMAVSNKLKPLAAAPPETLRVNQKGIKPIKIRNIVNATMTTNSLMPLRLNGPSRRFYAMWSDVNPRDKNDVMKKEWIEYWEDRWTWMKNGGWKAVVHYLINEVDLSDFNPAEAPPMTDFLRDIRDASKSPMQQTIESFIENKYGVFRFDVLTSSDMSNALMVGGLVSDQILADPKLFTSKRVGTILREMGVTHVRTSACRFWIIRNEQKHLQLSSAELVKLYDQQMNDTKGQHNIGVVR